MRKAEKPPVATSRPGNLGGSPGREHDCPDRAPEAPTVRWPRRLPGFSLPARAGMLVFTALLVLGFHLLSSGWIWPESDPAENYLHAEVSFPKLNITSAEARAPQSEPNRLDLGIKELRESSPVPRPASAPEPIVPAQQATAPGPDLVTEPLVLSPWAPVAEQGYRDQQPHRGDSPMMTTWKMLGSLALLAGSVTLAPAQAPPPPANSDNPKPLDLSALTKQIDDLKNSVNEVKGQVSNLSKMTDKMGQIDTAVAGYQATLNNERDQVTALNGRFEDLSKQLNQLRQDVDVLKSRQPTSTQISGYAPAASATTGRIQLLNTYYQPATFIVNGQRYEVPAGGARMIDSIPAGSFIYEVLGVQAPMTRTLAANETYNITVHP